MRRSEDDDEEAPEEVEEGAEDDPEATPSGDGLVVQDEGEDDEGEGEDEDEKSGLKREADELRRYGRKASSSHPPYTDRGNKPKPLPGSKWKWIDGWGWGDIPIRPCHESGACNSRGYTKRERRPKCYPPPPEPPTWGRVWSRVDVFVSDDDNRRVRRNRKLEARLRLVTVERGYAPSEAAYARALLSKIDLGGGRQLYAAPNRWAAAPPNKTKDKAWIVDRETENVSARALARTLARIMETLGAGLLGGPFSRAWLPETDTEPQHKAARPSRWAEDERFARVRLSHKKRRRHKDVPPVKYWDQWYLENSCYFERRRRLSLQGEHLTTRYLLEGGMITVCPPETVTRRKMGRPAYGDRPLSAKERKQLERARKKALGSMLVVLLVHTSLVGSAAVAEKWDRYVAAKWGERLAKYKKAA
jgi:hypothetical protein